MSLGELMWVQGVQLLVALGILCGALVTSIWVVLLFVVARRANVVEKSCSECERRELEEEKRLDQERANWLAKAAKAYKEMCDADTTFVDDWREEFNELTVTEVCGDLGWDVPEWVLVRAETSYTMQDLCHLS